MKLTNDNNETDKDDGSNSGDDDDNDGDGDVAGDSGEVKVDGNGTHHAGFMLHNLVDGCYTPVGRSR